MCFISLYSIIYACPEDFLLCRSFQFLIKYIPSIFDKVVSVVVSYFLSSYGKHIQAGYEFSWFSSRFCPELKEFKCNYSVAHNFNISTVRQLWQTLKCFKNCDASEVMQLSYSLDSICCGVLKLITQENSEAIKPEWI